MTQALSPKRMLLYGGTCAGVVVALVWTTLPAEGGHWTRDGAVLLTVCGAAAFFVGALIEIVTHARAARRFSRGRSWLPHSPFDVGCGGDGSKVDDRDDLSSPGEPRSVPGRGEVR